MGFRRLHNLPLSLIHFNYLIHLLCNLQPMFPAWYSLVVYLMCRCATPHAKLTVRKMRTSHSTEERDAVLALSPQHLFIIFKIYTCNTCSNYIMLKIHPYKLGKKQKQRPNFHFSTHNVKHHIKFLKLSI